MKIKLGSIITCQIDSNWIVKQYNDNLLFNINGGIHLFVVLDEQKRNMTS